MVNVIDTRNSVLNTFLSEIRAVDIQQDRMRFRRNLERVGEVMAYEISKTFDYSARTIQTPINPISVMLPRQEVVIASVIASRQGVEYVEKELAGEPLTLWTAALDEALTDKFYIDPGLGDAGDLAFGDKK